MNITKERNGGVDPKPPVPVKVRYCLYARKSTEQEDKQVLSIDSQIHEMEKMAANDNLDIVMMKKESHSAKEAGQRPVFNEIVEELKQGKYTGILTWAPDRIARNAGDLGRIVDLMDQKKLLEIRTFGQRFTNTPNDKFMLMILGSQAKLENDNKVINVKRGLRARCETGYRPGIAPTGYLNERDRDKRCQMYVDPIRAPIIKSVFEKVGSGWSGRKVYQWLNEINFTTKTDHRLLLGNLYIILRNPFYTGDFEYPRKSGNWYHGKHEPLVTKELFEKVQKTIADNSIAKTNSKEFAFTKLIRCGHCDSGITADEKFKKLKDGGTNRHVYYFCTTAKQVECKNPAINEKELIAELLPILDKVALDRIGIRAKIEEELNRVDKFQTDILGVANPKKTKVKEIDVRNYAKYLLREGTILEKREILSCLKSKLTLMDKKIIMNEEAVA